MKRRVQERGELDWSAEDFIELQSQPFEAVDAIFSVFGDIAVSGCNIVNKTIGSGVVILDGKIMPFEETTVDAFPCYMSALITPVNARYVDGLLKPVSYEYKAIIVTVKPTDKGCITVTSSGVDKVLKRSSDLTNSNSSETMASSKALKIVADEVKGKANTSHSHSGYEPAFSKLSAFNKNFGNAEGTVCQGNDSRLSNARVASDVPAWAKEETKPSYTATEVGAAENNHGHSNLALTTLSNTTLVKNLSSNGYYKAPDGLLIQWGYYSSGASNNTIYFPTSFMSVYSVIGTIEHSAARSSIDLYINTISISSFRARRFWIDARGGEGDSGDPFYWIAIGKWK